MIKYILIITAVIIDVMRSYLPKIVLFNTLKLEVKSTDGSREIVPVRIQENNKPYLIMPSSSAQVTAKKGIVRMAYINNPEKQMLDHHQVILHDNGVKVKAVSKCRYAATVFMLVLLTAFNVFGKSFVNSKLKNIPEYTKGVELEEPKDTGYDDRYKDTLNVLVVGSDARDGREDARADTMFLVSINKKLKQINILSLLRDTYVDIYDPNTITVDELPDSPSAKYIALSAANSHWIKGKLNWAVEYGTDEDYRTGLTRLVSTIEHNYGIPIYGVVSMGWSDVVTIIDQMGGMEMTIPEELFEEGTVEIDGEEHPCGIKAVLANNNEELGRKDSFPADAPGMRKRYNGNQILAYLRTRYTVNGENSDSERTSRQRKFLREFVFQKLTDILTLDQEKIKSICSNLYNSFSDEQIKEITDIIFEIPNVESKGSIPGLYYNERVDGTDYCVVDGKNYPTLREQALNAVSPKR